MVEGLCGGVKQRLKCRIILKERVWLQVGAFTVKMFRRLACAFSLRLQGCEIYALVKAVNYMYGRKCVSVVRIP